jgi:ABC-type multidrug transport system fused ATPase/permease subunit
MFGIGGENLTLAVRRKLFEGILYKHVGWFDSKDKAPGVLTNMLSEDISTLNGLTTETISILAETFLGLLISCAICIYFEWRLGLICVAVSPCMVLGGLFMSKLQFQQGAMEDNYRDSNALLSDIIMNYRTIISFGEKNITFMLSKY